MAEGKEKRIQKKYGAYELEGENLVRKRKFCPKCGPGVFLAEHSDRFSCGKCGYMEKKPSGGSPKEAGQKPSTEASEGKGGEPSLKPREKRSQESKAEEPGAPKSGGRKRPEAGPAEGQAEKSE